MDWGAIKGAIIGVRVLVVDDDKDTLDLYGFLLQKAGAAVECAPSGPAALAALEPFGPDVLLSDLAMPHMDGLELIRRVRSREDAFRSLPAIAFTAHADRDSLAHARAQGFDVALAKPVAPPALVAAIREVLPARPLKERRSVDRDVAMTLFVTRGSAASDAARERLASIVLEVEPCLLSFETRDLASAEGVFVPPGSLGDAVLKVERTGCDPVFIVDALRSRLETLSALDQAGVPVLGRTGQG